MCSSMTLALCGRFASMTPGLDEVAQDRRFPERPARFEPVETFDKDQARTILSDHVPVPHGLHRACYRRAFLWSVLLEVGTGHIHWCQSGTPPGIIPWKRAGGSEAVGHPKSLAHMVALTPPLGTINSVRR